MLEGFLDVFEGCEELLVGPGEDDCAVFDLGDRFLVQSCDMFLDGVHFPRGASPRQVGWHAAAASVADVASMGADVLGLTLSIAAPGDAEVGLIRGIAEGAEEVMRLSGGCVAGGDLARGDLAVDCGVVGTAALGDLVKRSGASEGDAVCVTGPLGGAAAGEAVLKDEVEIPSEEAALRRLLEPPVVAGHGSAIAGVATAATDLSDGLYRGMELISSSSGVGVSVDLGEVPLHGCAEETVAAGMDPVDLVDRGGDYELLFTVPHGGAEELGFPVVGEVGGDSVLLNGRSDGGYDAFRS